MDRHGSRRIVALTSGVLHPPKTSWIIPAAMVKTEKELASALAEGCCL
jgi:hypothetical protein